MGTGNMGTLSVLFQMRTWVRLGWAAVLCMFPEGSAGGMPMQWGLQNKCQQGCVVEAS